MLVSMVPARLPILQLQTGKLPGRFHLRSKVGRRVLKTCDVRTGISKKVFAPTDYWCVRRYARQRSMSLNREPATVDPMFGWGSDAPDLDRAAQLGVAKINIGDQAWRLAERLESAGQPSLPGGNQERRKGEWS